MPDTRNALVGALDTSGTLIGKFGSGVRGVARVGISTLGIALSVLSFDFSTSRLVSFSLRVGAGISPFVLGTPGRELSELTREPGIEAL